MSKKYKQTKKIKQKKILKGGFYPSVYGGVASASVLAVAAARQGYRLWNNKSKRNRKTKKQRRTRKH
jgi:hypothetical protein